MISSNKSEKIQNWVNRVISDSLAKILLENSQFTQIQLETFLIDVLADQMTDRKVSYVEKSMMRITGKTISRGAFNRTLQQARKNMIRSVLTVLLLGYIGVLETPSLSPFIEASNKLESYMREFAIIQNEKEKIVKDENVLKSMVILRESLKNTIYSLITPKKNLYNA